MTKYRAIVSIEFDQEEIESFLEEIGADPESADPHDDLNSALDNLPFGSAWIEQIFEDGKPTIQRLSGGIMVEVNDHE